ncbi:MAG TPA: ABC transporter permease [Verrucomicrobiae bacterium]|nr:ABC transporter permease [Verrucomicrobiae bacterium]
MARRVGEEGRAAERAIRRTRAPFPRWLPRRLTALELLATLARRRALAIKLGFPLVLVVPLVATSAPPFFAGMLLTVLVTLIGAVGTGVTVVRARGGGWLARLAVLPLSPARVGVELLLASWLVDAVQGSLVIGLVLAWRQPAPLVGLTCWLLVLAVLAIANALGLALAALTDHPGETMLGLAVLLAPLLFLAGLFTGVPAAGPRAWIAVVLPFTYLDQAFQLVLGGNPPSGAPPSFALAAAVTALVAIASAAALGGAVLRREG